MKTKILIGQLLVLSQLQLVFGLFDNDERIRPQIFGSTTGENDYYAPLFINTSIAFNKRPLERTSLNAFPAGTRR